MGKIMDKSKVTDLGYIIIGCLLNAYALAGILEPAGLATSGYQGIAIVLEKLINVRYTYIYYLFSIITLILAYKFLGKKDVVRIIVVTLIYPNLILVFDKINLIFPSNNVMLATIYFGVISGVGSGMLYRKGYTFGGTDTLAKILQKTVFKYATLAELLMVINGLTIVASYFVLGGEVVLYAIINHVICTKLLDYVACEWGTKLYRLEVITPKYEGIRDYILSLGRGVTLYEVVGGYTGEVKIKMSSTVSPKQLVQIKSKIAEIDTEAFVEITHITSVYSTSGARFQNISECKIK